MLFYSQIIVHIPVGDVFFIKKIFKKLIERHKMSFKLEGIKTLNRYAVAKSNTRQIADR